MVKALSNFHVVNLGCKVNKVESDSYASLCLSAGLEETPLESAHLVVVNTCAVTGEAEKKTRTTVRHVCSCNSQGIILVTGCSAALHASVYEEMSPRVKVVAKALTTDYLKGLLEEKFGSAKLPESVIAPVGEGFRTRVGVKVQDGCDNACTYCIVHVARGKATSRDAQEIIDEVRKYDALGVKELVLTGINLGSYRNQVDGHCLDLAGLLSILLDITNHLESNEPDMRFRVGSIEPMDISDSFVELMAASNGRICRHLHLPLQSGSTKVLREMNRPYTAEDFLALVDKLRKAAPSLSLSTDIIVGFPGETEEEFQETCQLARQCAFSKIHVFPYSLRRGTTAALRSDQIDASVKSARASELRKLGNALALQDKMNRAGTQELALVESDGTWMTESYHSVDAQDEATVGSLVPYFFTK